MCPGTCSDKSRYDSRLLLLAWRRSSQGGRFAVRWLDCGAATTATLSPQFVAAAARFFKSQLVQIAWDGRYHFLEKNSGDLI